MRIKTLAFLLLVPGILASQPQTEFPSVVISLEQGIIPDWTDLVEQVRPMVEEYRQHPGSILFAIGTSSSMKWVGASAKRNKALDATVRRGRADAADYAIKQLMKENGLAEGELHHVRTLAIPGEDKDGNPYIEVYVAPESAIPAITQNYLDRRVETLEAKGKIILPIVDGLPAQLDLENQARLDRLIDALEEDPKGQLIILAIEDESRLIVDYGEGLGDLSPQAPFDNAGPRASAAEVLKDRMVVARGVDPNRILIVPVQTRAGGAYGETSNNKRSHVGGSFGVSTQSSSGRGDHLTPGAERPGIVPTVDIGLWIRDLWSEGKDDIGILCRIQPPGRFFENEHQEWRIKDTHLSEIKALFRVVGPVCLSFSRQQYISQRVRRDTILRGPQYFTEKYYGWGPGIEIVDLPFGFSVGGSIYPWVTRKYEFSDWHIDEEDSKTHGQAYLSWRVRFPR